MIREMLDLSDAAWERIEELTRSGLWGKDEVDTLRLMFLGTLREISRFNPIESGTQPSSIRR